MNRWLGLATTALLCSACGGGSGSGTDSVNVPDDKTPSELVLYGETSAVIGESIEFAIATNTGSALDNINWRSDNDAITFLAGHTQVIGFDAPAAGDYPFTVTATTSAGQQLEHEFVLSVIEDQTPHINVRVGREATELGRVSLRAFTTAPQNTQVTRITWQQVSGPKVLNLTNDDTRPGNNIFFQAPNVERDELIVFRATATFSDNSTATDDALVLVNNAAYSDNDAAVTRDLNNDGILETVSTRMLVANPDSKYADVLQDCIYSNTLEESCQFGRLPLLGSETETPNIEDVMDRTLVSHPWMADAFREYLKSNAAGNDIINLLRANTGVVISYDVRPSYYTSITATIYLDARYFWRTPQERDTLDNAPDYRSDFGNQLQFNTTYRYIKDEEVVFPRPAPSVYERQQRTLDDLGPGLTRVLYHELAHANDYFDYTTWAGLSDTASPLSTFLDRQGNINSDRLDQRDPLTSIELHELADVRFGGETATAEQRGYTADMVGNWLDEDSAVDDYSYSTIREDFAMLFERFMMLYRSGMSADEGVFTRATIESGDFIISYGNRNRVARPDVTSRATFVVSNVLPEVDINAAVAGFPDAQLLPAGESWFDTVSLGGSAEKNAKASALSTKQKRELINAAIRERASHGENK